MLPEGTNGTGGDGLAVPMAWLCAEYVADELLRTGGLVETGTVEFRAGRATLALTIYLCGGADEPATGVRTVTRLDEWLTRTAYGHPWPQWVRERIGVLEAFECDVTGPDADLELARDTWRWLQHTEVLAADLGDQSGLWPPALPQEDPAVDESEQVWTPAWRLGLPLGHLAMHLY
ncbi:hypothetical protein V1460_14920 [Streptomyces sp. SCSIO 30461]|uniref:hypothetical protein n=1 Tax=Streptomyces sp. SCSIO 30461 TaxID=3118085 RepID=UPI0030D17D72